MAAAAEETAGSPSGGEVHASSLWLESPTVRSAWEGDSLQRILDEETGEPCLEWFQDPAVKASIRTGLPGVDPAEYDAVRLQWKHLGGGSSITVQVGQRQWYLYKDTYRPGQWRDVWLDLKLDDDMGGPLLADRGRCVVQLHFNNLPLLRKEERTWRRIRVRNLRLVRFPVRLSCDPTRVEYGQDDACVFTRYPLNLQNTTPAARDVELFIDPMRLLDFEASFEASETRLGPQESKVVWLSFSMKREKAARHSPLYMEEAPVYARVKGDPDSLTTWFRAFVQWKAGGILVPPGLPSARGAASERPRPWMVKPGTRERILERAQHHEWADKIVKNWISAADRAVEKEVRVPEVRHGYSVGGLCPEHTTSVRLDTEHFKRHFCEKGNHFVEGNAALDRLAALEVHLLHSKNCGFLGWAYYLTGQERYARKAGDILLAYAQVYPQWDYVKKESVGYWSRVAHAVLGECWWIHGMVNGYDVEMRFRISTAEN